MFNNLIGKNKELGRFLFCERYTLQPVKDAMYIAEGQELKRGAVVDVNGVLVGTSSILPYAVLEFDCDTRDGGKQASVFIKGEFNFDKLSFASGLSKSDMDNIVYNGNSVGIVIKPYEYDDGFNPIMAPAGTSEDNPLMTAADTERMILENTTPAANTLRFSFSKLDYSPVVAEVGSSGTWKKVSKFAENNVWDWTRNNTYWGTAFKNAFTSSDNFVSVIGCGTLSSPTAMYQTFMGSTALKYVCYLPSTTITNFESAFSGCSSLETIEFFDTTAAITIQNCFYNCSSLKKLPLISSASNMTRVSSAFYGCVNVESGALDNYNTLSAVAGIDSYANTFKDCGKNTTTGAAELAQIPASWGGTGT